MESWKMWNHALLKERLGKEGEISLNAQCGNRVLVLNDGKAEGDGRGCLVKQLWIMQP